MRRVLVPLDGSELSEAIIPDARRLAGTDGELILVREASGRVLERDMLVDTSMSALENAETYLAHEADKLRAEGVTVRTRSFVLTDAASAIDEAVRIFKADVIAIATHGRRPLGRVLHGSTAWRALAHSPVPVLLRHVESGSPPVDDGGKKRRIMVPLDGSKYAEKALPLAQELALEWNAPLWLVQVVPQYAVTDTPYTPGDFVAQTPDEVVNEAQVYLERIAVAISAEAYAEAGFGSVPDTLVEYVDQFSITDLIMASHGRTGLSRVILGSVADEIIHRLHGPIIVVPALAAGRLEDHPLVDTHEPMVSTPSQKAST